MTTAIGILAAGASTRMRGRDKLLEDVDGQPLLARQIGIAAAFRLPVLVALPPDPGPRHNIAKAAGATSVIVSDAADGMSASISALAERAERIRADALLLHLADMPDIEGSEIAAILLASRRNPFAVVRAAASDGRPGHPVLFPSAHFASLRRLSGDKGAREVIAAAPEVRLVHLAGNCAVTDLDTPEAWETWRAARRGEIS